MRRLLRLCPSSLVLVVLAGSLLPGDRRSPHDFPFGYPFPDYPLGGASSPRLSNDYLRQEPDPVREVKRIGPYALRLIQTGRPAAAVAYADRYRLEHPGWLDGEMLFMRALAQVQLGAMDDAVQSMTRAIDEGGLPAERFLAGPRRLFRALHNEPAFQSLRSRFEHGLVHGPMLGAMTDRSVRFWVRTDDETPVQVAVGRSPALTDRRVSARVISRAADDYTAVLEVDGLQPDTEYHYVVSVGEAVRVVSGDHQRFRTFPAAGGPARFTIAFGGCAGYVPAHERMWDTVRSFHPRALLMLGDNVYIDDPESPDQQRYCYYQRQSRPEFRRLVGSSPVYAIWDDHDFAMDDCWGGPAVDVPYWKPMVLEIFRQNWVNPTYGAGPDRPGVWFDFRVADVHFILLDGRHYRTDAGRFGGGGVPEPTLLGPHQLAWLERTLTGSDATFKVLISPVSWHDQAKPGQGGLDTWAGYRTERETIFSWIRDRGIEGVFLLSADRHRSDAWRHERPDDYDLHEFASARFTNQHTHSLMKGALFGYNTQPSFGLLTFDTAAEDPSVTYAIVDIDGVIRESLTLRRSTLRRVRN